MHDDDLGVRDDRPINDDRVVDGTGVNDHVAMIADNDSVVIDHDVASIDD